MCTDSPDDRSPKRVAQLIQTLGMGGAERLAVQLANAHAAAGDHSFLYVLCGPDLLSSQIDSRVHVRYLRWEWPKTNLFRMVPALLAGHRALLTQLRQDAVRIVQTHLPAANYLGLALAWRRRAMVVATVHNTQEFRYGDAVQPMRAELRRRAYRQIVRRCPVVVAVATAVKESLIADLELTATDAERIQVIPNGVEIPAPLPLAEILAVRQRYGIEANEQLVLAAGRMTEQKNFAALVAALTPLLRSRGQCRLLLAGDGPLRAELTEQVRASGLCHQVLLPGNVTDLSALLQAADLFVLPSRWEGLPLVLLEAMAAGLAVVASRIESVQNVITDGEDGILVPPGDETKLAAAVEQLLDDPDRRAGVAVAGRDTVASHYTFERVALQTQELYTRLVVSSTTAG
ncbi:MAG: glycosyltransferase [bacterium]